MVNVKVIMSRLVTLYIHDIVENVEKLIVGVTNDNAHIHDIVLNLKHDSNTLLTTRMYNHTIQ